MLSIHVAGGDSDGSRRSERSERPPEIRPRFIDPERGRGEGVLLPRIDYATPSWVGPKSRLFSGGRSLRSDHRLPYEQPQVAEDPYVLLRFFGLAAVFVALAAGFFTAAFFAATFAFGGASE